MEVSDLNPKRGGHQAWKFEGDDAEKGRRLALNAYLLRLLTLDLFVYSTKPYPDMEF